MEAKKLKMLLRFTMAKRIGNTTFLGLNALLLCLFFGIVFSDFVILWFDGDFFRQQQVVVQEDASLARYLEDALPQMEIVLGSEEMDWQSRLKEGSWMIRKDGDYQVLSENPFATVSWIELQHAILQYDETERLQALGMEEFLRRKAPRVVGVVMAEEKESTVNQTWAFLLITSIYFVALSYVGIAASDVVYEKSTRMMELILTSVSSTTHLIAKLLSGWFVLIFQVGLMGVGMVLAMGVRYLYDQGRGFLKVLVQLALLPSNVELNLKALWNLISSQPGVGVKLLVGLLFMLIGILFVQTILVILSSFIGSIEESGTIQSPFYLLFMGVYYLTLFLNQPEPMNVGLGKTLSMLPFFSMLFMPCRMFYYQVAWMEVAISLLIAMGSLVLLWMVGAPIYQLGVLDYSSQNLFSKLKTSISDAFLQRG